MASLISDHTLTTENYDFLERYIYRQTGIALGSDKGAQRNVMCRATCEIHCDTKLPLNRAITQSSHHQRELRMKRMLAVLAFLAGGIATEMAHPVQCLLVSPSRVQLKRQRQRSIDGNH